MEKGRSMAPCQSGKKFEGEGSEIVSVMGFLRRANRRETVLLLWLSLGRNSKRWAGDRAEHKIPHFPPAWSLGWSRAALGQAVEGGKRELVAENICLVGGILPLVTSAVRLGAEQESAGWAGEDMAGGERGNRQTQTWMWQQSSEGPDEVSRHKTIYIQCSLLFYIGLCSFSLIKQPWSGLPHFENLAGKLKWRSMMKVFVFLSVPDTYFMGEVAG